MIDDEYEPETYKSPCWECIKGRHLNCNGSCEDGTIFSSSDEPCDCPCDPDDPDNYMATRDLVLEYDPEIEAYVITEGVTRHV